MFNFCPVVIITSNCTFTDTEHDLFKDNVPATASKHLTLVHRYFVLRLSTSLVYCVLITCWRLMNDFVAF